MMWLIPRFDPGALTAHHRPHAGGVSTARGQRLPYGAFPRLVMLWMYAEGARDAHDPPQDRDPVLSICQYLLTIDLESPEVTPLFEQADRLFACRFRVGQRTIPVIDPSFVRNADAALRLPEVASTRGMQLAYSAPFHQETMRRRFAPRLATVRALRHCPFALDVYLWDAGYGQRAPSGTAPARSRLGVYHALADHPAHCPSISEVLAFERELATVRETLRRLEEEPDPACGGGLLG